MLLMPQYIFSARLQISRLAFAEDPRPFSDSDFRTLDFLYLKRRRKIDEGKLEIVREPLNVRGLGSMEFVAKRCVIIDVEPFPMDRDPSLKTSVR